MHTVIAELEQAQIRSDLPDFRPGDTLKVHVRVVEGSRSRIQIFQGVVIRRQGGGARETFTVRKISYGVGVERTFPVHSPSIDKIEVVTRGRVRRAKLYYLRSLRGKRAANPGAPRHQRGNRARPVLPLPQMPGAGAPEQPSRGARLARPGVRAGRTAAVWLRSGVHHRDQGLRRPSIPGPDRLDGRYAAPR